MLTACIVLYCIVLYCIVLGVLIYFRCIGTLRVVTARELVVLSGSFMSHSMLVRRLHHLRGHASRERYTVSIVEGREINLHKPLQSTAGIEPGAAA